MTSPTAPQPEPDSNPLPTPPRPSKADRLRMRVTQLAPNLTLPKPNALPLSDNSAVNQMEQIVGLLAARMDQVAKLVEDVASTLFAAVGEMNDLMRILEVVIGQQDESNQKLLEGVTNLGVATSAIMRTTGDLQTIVDYENDQAGNPLGLQSQEG